MKPAGDHVDHRQGKRRGVRIRSASLLDMFLPEPVQVNEQLLAPRGGRGVGHGQRDAQHGVGPQPALVRRAVEREQSGVDARPGRPASMPTTAGAISQVTLSTARNTPRPP